MVKRYRVRVGDGIILLKTNDKKLVDEVVTKLKGRCRVEVVNNEGGEFNEGCVGSV